MGEYISLTVRWILFSSADNKIILQRKLEVSIALILTQISKHKLEIPCKIVFKILLKYTQLYHYFHYSLEMLLILAVADLVYLSYFFLFAKGIGERFCNAIR